MHISVTLHYLLFSWLSLSHTYLSYILVQFIIIYHIHSTVVLVYSLVD